MSCETGRQSCCALVNQRNPSCGMAQRANPKNGVLALTCDTLLSSQGAGAHRNLAFRPRFGATFLTYGFRLGESNRPEWAIRPEKDSFSHPREPAWLGALSAAWCPFLPRGRPNYTARPPNLQIRSPGAARGGGGQGRTTVVRAGGQRTRMAPKDFFPRRSTSHSPCSRSSVAGAKASSVTRALLQ